MLFERCDAERSIAITITITIKKVRRQQSLPTDSVRESRPSLPSSMLASQLETFLGGIKKKYRSKSEGRAPEEEKKGERRSRGDLPQNSLRVGISKMLTRWKTETRESTRDGKSFTQKKGVNIDPINVFGTIRRDQSLDSATRRGLFHKKGAFSPKSPKEWLEVSGREESSGLLSPSLRRCCLECPEEAATQERRLSRGEGGSDSSKDGSIQSDTSLDSEDSCVSVIFVPNHEDKIALPSQPSTSNSSESSESPTGWASPDGGKALSPVKTRTKKSEESRSPPKVPSPEQQETETKEQMSTTLTPGHLTPLSKVPEHKSFELEDLPNNDNPINCHTRAFAERVECETPPLSPLPAKPSSNYDYPIVRHHPLFAKSQRCRSGTISSLLVGENIEFFRKPGSARTGVQSTRKSTPKLLTFEIYNPETDDLDSDSSLSSSPESGESVVSVISDKKSFEMKKELEGQSGSRAEERTPEEEKVFNFDFPGNNDKENYLPESTKNSEEETIFRFDFPGGQSAKSSCEEIDEAIYTNEEAAEEDPVDKKLERRKQELISLLEQNKAMLEEEEIVFKFDLTGSQEDEEATTPEAIGDINPVGPTEQDMLINEENLEKKSERRKQELMFLLDENKAMLDDITKTRAVEEVSWKTASQLQSMEELRLPSLSRSSSSSPERRDCHSEGEHQGKKKESDRQGSLEGVPNITEETVTKRKVSSACKLLQISHRVEEEEIMDDLQMVAPVAICVTEVDSIDTGAKDGETDLSQVGGNNRDNSSSSSVSPSASSPSAISPSAVSPSNISPSNISPSNISPSNISPSNISPSNVSPSNISPLAVSPSAVSPEASSKRKESFGKVQSDSREDEKVVLPSRRPDKRRRDDSLESNSASIKSNTVQLSDTGSLLSHRFSTISISSNVSSDVSLGNTSAVSGSSCYLASMSSADFDDRPVLASSFSLSEADEEDKDKENAGEGKDVSSPPKKDQLSPPRTGNGTKQMVLSGRGETRPKLKSLFKRASDGKSKSHSSSEGRSREGDAECLAVKGARSRISTLSSMTPDTSLEQSTCVERCSSSFEEELIRSKTHDTEVGDDNAFSASDSDDSAEAGGNLTHHRLTLSLDKTINDNDLFPPDIITSSGKGKLTT